jgi:hypothetical protein
MLALALGLTMLARETIDSRLPHPDGVPLRSLGADTYGLPRADLVCAQWDPRQHGRDELYLCGTAPCRSGRQHLGVVVRVGQDGLLPLPADVSSYEQPYRFTPIWRSLF